MQDFLLILIVLATFIFGWFLMKKVDIFLEEWQREMDGQHEKEWENHYEEENRWNCQDKTRISSCEQSITMHRMHQKEN